MIELSYYEKRTLHIRPAQMLALDEKVRQSWNLTDEDPVLIHQILVEAKGMYSWVVFPDVEKMEPDDECVVPSASHLGHTRAELVKWLAQKQAEAIDGIPDIFEDVPDEDPPTCKVCQSPLDEAGNCPNCKVGNAEYWS